MRKETFETYGFLLCAGDNSRPEDFPELKGKCYYRVAQDLLDDEEDRAIKCIYDVMLINSTIKNLKKIVESLEKYITFDEHKRIAKNSRIHAIEPMLQEKLIKENASICLAQYKIECMFNDKV